MSRQKPGLLEDLFEIATKLPWWAGIALAVVSYFSLHTYVANRSTLIRSVQHISATISTQTFVGAASIFQYVLPLIFIAGAIASLFMRAKRRSDPDLNLSTPDSRIEPTLSVSRTAIRTDRLSLELLRAIDWKRFEEVCAEYFRVIGFRALTQSQGPDGGIDITLYPADDPARVGAIVQCKRWSGIVGPKLVREFLGVMTDHRISEGVFVTSSTFNDDAIRLAVDNHIDLIDGKDLLRKILALAPVQQERLLKVATEGDYLTPTCANCGIKLVVRENRKDKSKFWACLNYPRCKFKLFL